MSHLKSEYFGILLSCLQIVITLIVAYFVNWKSNKISNELKLRDTVLKQFEINHKLKNELIKENRLEIDCFIKMLYKLDRKIKSRIIEEEDVTNEDVDEWLKDVDDSFDKTGFWLEDCEQIFNTMYNLLKNLKKIEDLKDRKYVLEYIVREIDNSVELCISSAIQRAESSAKEVIETLSNCKTT